MIPSILMFSLLVYKQIKSANWLSFVSFETKIAYNWSSQRAGPCREKLTIFNHIISLFFPDIFTQHLVRWIFWNFCVREFKSFKTPELPKVVTTTPNSCGKFYTEQSGGCQQGFPGIRGGEVWFPEKGKLVINSPRYDLRFQGLGGQICMESCW